MPTSLLLQKSISIFMVLMLSVIPSLVHSQSKPGNESERAIKTPANNADENRLIKREAGLRQLSEIIPLPEDLTGFLRKSIVDSINMRKSFNAGRSIHDNRIIGNRELMGNDMIGRLSDTAFQDFLLYVKNNFGSQKVKSLVNGFSASGNKETFNNYVDQKIKGFYSVLGSNSMNIPFPRGGFKNTFQGASYSTIFQDQSGYANPWLHEIRISDAINLFQIPFRIEFSNLSDEIHAFSYNNFLKFSFDRRGFTSGLQYKLSGYYDMRKYFLGDIDLLSYTKKHFEAEIARSIVAAKNEFLGDPESFLLSKVNYDEMMKLDMPQIREKLLPRESEQQLRDKLAGQQQFIVDNGHQLSPTQKDSLDKMISDQVGYLSSIEEVLKNLTIVKQKQSSGGLNINSVAALQQGVNSKLDEILKQPSTIHKAAGQLLPLNGLQKLFMHLNSVNAGSFGANLSERSVSDLFLTGLQFTGLKNNKYFAGGLGKSREGSTLKDAGLQQTIYNPAQFMQFIRLGKGEIEKAHSHFSILNVNSSSVDNDRIQSFSLPRNTLVGTFSKTMNVGKSGWVEAEISKSSTQYRDVDANADQVLAQKSAFFSYAEDLWQTLSVGIRYMDNWEKIGLNHNVHVSYAGYGYNNPGNPSSARGAMQYDLQLRKQIGGRRGTIQGRVSRRSYNYSADGDTKWRNLQFSLDGRYRFSRHLTAALRVNQYQMTKVSEAANNRLYVSRKASVDANTSYTLKGIPIRTNLSLGWQQFDNIYIKNGSSSDLLLLQLAQMAPIGKNLLSITLLYNKELQENQIIGDMLNAEMGINYPVKDVVSLGSALTYLDNKLAARQIGIRQSITATVFRKASVSFFVDWRKNLIQSLNPYLYSSFRGEFSIHYLIN
ncbi:MAG TPA: hypothetical protein VGD17_16500 [Chitinophagaceae bacterium]